ncbi:MAG: TonB-dependent receptor [Bacteroidota bacterium]
MKRKMYYMLLALMVQAMALMGQNDSLVTISEITVTATRSEKHPDEVGRSVTVITADSIKSLAYNSLGELLAAEAGIYLVGANQNIGNTQSIFMRGSNSNQTIIMIDGIRISDPSAVNNAPDLSELSLADIERIEIVRGAHSTLFGSAAIGGAVNIITKKTMKEGLNADVSLTGGTFGSGTSLFAEDLRLAYKLKSGFYLSGEWYNVNMKGIDATVDTVTTPYVYKAPDMTDGLKKTDISFRAGFRREKWDIFAGYKLTDQATDIDKRAYVDDDNYTLDFRRNLITFGIQYELNDNMSVSASGGMTDMTRIAIDDSSVIGETPSFVPVYDRVYNKGEYTGKYSQGGIQLNYNTKGLDLVIGSDFSAEEMNANTFYYYYNAWAFPQPVYDTILSSLDTVMPSATTLGAYLHADLGGILFSEKLSYLSLGIGLRGGSHELFGSYFTYEVNPSVKIGDKGLLYASYATGFNAPSLYQLYTADQYVTWDMGYTTGLTRGNKDLNPETSRSFELGVKQRVNEGTWLGLSVFRTITDNTIEYVYLWDKNIGIDTLGENWGRDDYRGDRYLNLGTMTINGLELGVRSALSEKFSVSANFSIIGGSISYDPSDIDTSQTKGNHVQLFNSGQFLTKEYTVYGLTRRPPALANIALTYRPIKQLGLTAVVRHAGTRGDSRYESTLGPYGALATVPVADYTLVDLSAAFRLGAHFSGVLKAENIFDVEYYEINGFSTRGRSVYLKLAYSF